MRSPSGGYWSPRSFLVLVVEQSSPDGAAPYLLEPVCVLSGLDGLGMALVPPRGTEES